MPIESLPLDGPLKMASEENTDKTLRQELVTYMKRDGFIIRHTVVRVFTNNDYIDHKTSMVLDPE